MKVQLDGWYKALAENMKQEGDEIVDVGAELTLAPEQDWEFPRVVVEAMGYGLGELGDERFVAFRWWNLDGWSYQTLVGFPLRTLMNDGLGCEVGTGMACRFVQRDDLAALFENPDLEQALRQAGHRGFVTAGLTSSLSVTRLMTGVPFYGLLNMMESVKTKISTFLSGDEPELMESWTTSLVLSRWPWPLVATSERVAVLGLDDEISKHFWPLNVRSHRRSTFTDGTLVGVATSWSPTLGEACRRTIRTLNNIVVPGKQYRTDLFKVAGDGWAAVKIGS